VNAKHVYGVALSWCKIHLQCVVHFLLFDSKIVKVNVPAAVIYCRRVSAAAPIVLREFASSCPAATVSGSTTLQFFARYVPRYDNCDCLECSREQKPVVVVKGARVH
jgi:hypothetical protein